MQSKVWKILLFCLLFALFLSDKNSSKLAKKKATHPKLKKSAFKRNPNPVIGILTQPSPFLEYPKEEYSHIASAYIKGIEAAGGKAIPIRYDYPIEKIEKLLNGINGILLPGGGANIREWNETTGKRVFTSYGTMAKFLINYAKKENRNGRYFPVWGTCLGFEVMAMAYSGKKSVIRKVFGMVNHVDSLTFIQNVQNSKLYRKAPSHILKILEQKKVLYFNHKYAIYRDLFYFNKKLAKSFNILTLNEDHEGNVFVSSAEHKKFPFYGIQFHAEKNSYDWRDDVLIQRSMEAMEAQQYFANFFVNEARRSLSKLDEGFLGRVINSGGRFKPGYGMAMHFFRNYNSTKRKKAVKSKKAHKPSKANKTTDVVQKRKRKGSRRKSLIDFQYVYTFIGLLIAVLLLLILWSLQKKRARVVAKVEEDRNHIKNS